MAFLERPKVALSREQLLDLTKGRDAEVFDRSVDNQVSRLRRKIEQDPKNPRYIKTVWGGGYMFTSDVEILCCALSHRSAPSSSRWSPRPRPFPPSRPC